MTDDLSLKTMLEILSHNILMIALAFSLAGAVLFQTDPNISRAMGLTAGVLLILSTAVHRLSNR